MRDFLLYVVGRVFSGVVAGVGIAVDITGASIHDTSGQDWLWVAIIALVFFCVLSIAQDAEDWLRAKPHIAARLEHSADVINEVHMAELIMVVRNEPQKRGMGSSATDILARIDYDSGLLKIEPYW